MPHTHPEGVPLNIWPVAAGDGRAARLRLATRAVEEYAPAGGVVVDVCPGRGEALAACAASGRHAVALPPSAACDGRLRSASLRRLANEVDLVLSLPPAERLAPPRPWSTSPAAARSVARQARAVLRPGGLLVLGVVPRGGRDDAAATVAAAAVEGLAYFQHVVALLRDDVEERAAAGGRVAAHADVLVFERRAA